MKKSAVLFFVICFTSMFAALFSSSWDGGDVRLMGAGNCVIVLPDSTNIADLFGAGFSSFLIGRDKKNVISLSGTRDIMNDSFFLRSDVTGLDFSGEKSNYMLFWFSPGDALMIQPQYLNIFTPASLSEGSYIDNGGGARVRYSHSFGGGLSLGGMVKFAAKYSVTNATIWAPDPFTGQKETVRDFEFLLDAGLDLGNGFAFAVSAGQAVPLIYMKKPPNVISNFFYIYDFFGGDDQGYSVNGVAKGPSGNLVYKYEVEGININAGAQYIRPGVVEAVVSGGAVLGYGSKYSQAQTGSNDAGSDEKGTAYDASLKLRAFPASWLTAGFSAEGSGITFNWQDSPIQTKYTSDIAAGASYMGETVRVPVEFFAHFQDGTELLSRYGGIRGGVEWDALKWLTLRAGGSWPCIAEFVRDYSVKYLYELTAGFGLNFGGIKADCGVAYSARSQYESDAGGWEYSNKLTSIGLNIRYDM